MSSEKLKNVGLKITVPRAKILEIFYSKEKKHFGAYEVYDILRQNNINISLATIYRVIGQFEEVGILTRHEFDDDKAIYELSSSEHHDHMFCNKCGAVFEFYDETIERRQEQIAQKYNFKMTNHCLTLHGICENCQKS